MMMIKLKPVKPHPITAIFNLFRAKNRKNPLVDAGFLVPSRVERQRAATCIVWHGSEFQFADGILISRELHCSTQKEHSPKGTMSHTDES